MFGLRVLCFADMLSENTSHRKRRKHTPSSSSTDTTRISPQRSSQPTATLSSSPCIEIESIGTPSVDCATYNTVAGPSTTQCAQLEPAHPSPLVLKHQPIFHDLREIHPYNRNHRRASAPGTVGSWQAPVRQQQSTAPTFQRTSAITVLKVAPRAVTRGGAVQAVGFDRQRQNAVEREARRQRAINSEFSEIVAGVGDLIRLVEGEEHKQCTYGWFSAQANNARNIPNQNLPVHTMPLAKCEHCTKRSSDIRFFTGRCNFPPSFFCFKCNLNKRMIRSTEHNFIECPRPPTARELAYHIFRDPIFRAELIPGKIFVSDVVPVGEEVTDQQVRDFAAWASAKAEDNRLLNLHILIYQFAISIRAIGIRN